MSQTLIAISYFQYHSVLENGTNVYHFHFIGPYHGIYVRKIAVTSLQSLTFRKKTIYLLHLKYQEIKNSTLYAQLLFHKVIDDCLQI